MFAAEVDVEERKRLVVVLVLFVAATIFWSVFEQAGPPSTSRPAGHPTEAFGFPFPPSWLSRWRRSFWWCSPVFA
jgi:dipeptide/tripeptide permease